MSDRTETSDPAGSSGFEHEVPTDPNRPQGRARLIRVISICGWLVFLAYPLLAVARNPDPTARVAGMVVLVVFVAIYVPLLMHVQRVRWRDGAPLLPRGRIIVSLMALAVCTVALIPAAGADAMICLVFIAAAAMSTLPVRSGIAVAAMMLVISSVTAFTVPGWQDHNESLGVLLATATIFALRLAAQRTARLVEVERQLGRTAIDQERIRIAGDLHDILGHSLTVISLKAQVAERTMDRSPERARDEILEIERLSRDALADVRATALGVRGISLPGEIAEARAALAAAGIDAELPGVTDEVASDCRELFAWTIREAVTNVVRHSQASRCTVTLGPRRVTVVDDGVGPSGASATGDRFSGHGLEGLRRRVARAGGTIVIGPGHAGRGFAVEVEIRHERPGN